MSHNGQRTRRYSTTSVRSKSKSSRSSSPTLLRDTFRGRIASDRINSVTSRGSLSSDEVGWAEQRQRGLSNEISHPLYLQDLFVDPRNPRSDTSQKEGYELRDPIVPNTAPFPSLDRDSTFTLDEDARTSRKQSKPLAIRTTPSVLQHADSQDTVLQTRAVDVGDPPSFQGIFPTPLSNNMPFTYSSLPPTPITSSPPLGATTYPVTPTKPQAAYQQPFSIWDYLQEELLATDFDSHQEMKWERVSNFLNTPFAVEKVTQHHFPSWLKLTRQLDCRFRVYPVSRHLPVHLYNPSDTIYLGLLSFVGQSLLLEASSIFTRSSEGRHLAYITTSGINDNPYPSH